MSDYRALIAAAKRDWWVVVACFLTGALVGALVILVVPTTYAAQARVFIASPAWNDSTASPPPGQEGTMTAYGDEFTQQRMSSYLELLTSPLVTEPASRAVDRDAAKLAKGVSGRLVPDTVMLDISVTGSTPEEAEESTNAVVAEFISAVTALEKPASNRVSPVQPVVIARATVAESELVGVWTTLVIGAFVGLLVGLFLAVLIHTRSRGHSDDGAPALPVPIEKALV
ncbi:YveK family protein [Gordonia sp. NPDC003376]